MDSEELKEVGQVIEIFKWALSKSMLEKYGSEVVYVELMLPQQKEME